MKLKVYFIIVTTAFTSPKEKTNLNSMKDILKEHRESYHEGIYYKCDLCSYKGKSKTQLKKHIEDQHEGVLYNSNQCDYQNKSKGDLKNILI